jgi:hypothetical protein
LTEEERLWLVSARLNRPKVKAVAPNGRTKIRNFAKYFCRTASKSE